jgi:LmbE family N-acetylglucosaminyl deacetylase
MFIRFLIAMTLAAGLPLQALAASGPELGDAALHQAALDVGTDLRLMCVAAHPDDEDGATLALYRKKYGYTTYALIATRGEGGQNEIGPELYHELGAIRTREMMAASRVTGATLGFLDRPEFGYSKTLEETLVVWGEEDSLRRLVEKIRAFRPDVIISNHGNAKDHGHHQAVGHLLRKAFDVAADTDAFPESGAPWQVTRLYLRLWQDANEGVTVDINAFDSVRGKTYAEIAADALDEHNSQGMEFFIDRYLEGRIVPRYRLERAAPQVGLPASAVVAPGGVLFEGLADRVMPTRRTVSQSIARHRSTAENVLTLLPTETLQPNDPAYRLAAIQAELRLSASLDDAEAVPGQTVNVRFQLHDFGKPEADRVTFQSFREMTPREGIASDVPLDASHRADASVPLTVSADVPFSVPAADYLIARPYLQHEHRVRATVETTHGPIELEVPVYFDVAPPVHLQALDGPYLVRKGRDRSVQIPIQVTNHAPEGQRVTLAVVVPDGFEVAPTEVVGLPAEGDQCVVTATLDVARSVPAGDHRVRVRAVETGFETEALVRVVEFDVPRDVRVGVIQSYDDTYVRTLARLGVTHDVLTAMDFNAQRLDAYDVIVIDIRAYWVRPDLVANNQAVLDYATRGGTLFVNYQKTFEWQPEFAPYPITLSRNRVTKEDAAIHLLAPDHPLFMSPNAMERVDWAGWRQERGLYFPSEWDEAYAALIQCSDPGEDIPPGSLLVAEHGKGTYIYTALGWYRQLRELHPGALKFFANVLAL